MIKKAKDPKAVTEGLAAAGAAGALKVAAEAAPFSGFETTAEIAGGVAGPMVGGELTQQIIKRLILPPAKMVGGFLDSGLAGGADVLKQKFRDARAKKGFQSILKELESFGEIDTPEQLENLITALEKNSLADGQRRTAGQATKNPVFLAMEDTLKRQFGFLNQTQLDAKEAELETAQRLLSALYANQDTTIGKESLIAAAAVEEAMFNSYLTNRLTNAENNLLKSVNQLSRSKQRNVDDIDVDVSGRIEVTPANLVDLDSEDLMALAERLEGLVISQKKIARGQQNQLYNQVGELDVMFFDEDGGFREVPKFITMLESEQILDKSAVSTNLSNLLEYADKVKARFTPEGLRKPTSVKLDIEGNPKEIDATKDTSTTIPLSVLNARRKEALGIARDGTKDSETRRIAGMFAEAIQDDIFNLEEFGADNFSKRQIQALRQANSFSRAFYDVYRRSFVGKALRQDKEGAYREAFETFKFDGPRADINFSRIADIQAAGQFALDNNLDSAEAGVNSVHGVIDRIIRTARATAVDPATKRIDPVKLEDWMKSNARLEESFPDIFRDLRDVELQKALLESEENFETISQKVGKTQVGFTTLLKDAKGQVRSNPTFAVAEAFSPSADQFSRLESLISVIPKKGQNVQKQIYKVTNEQTGVEQTFFNRSEARDYARKMGSDFKQTQETIRVDRDMAIEGLKSSIFEYFVMGTPTGRADARVEKPFNADVIYNNLFERKFPTKFGRKAARTGKGEMSVAEYLQSKGIFDSTDVKTAQLALTELAQAQMVGAVDNLGINLEEAKPILDFALGVTGSAIGTRSQSLLMGGNAGPGSIIAAGKGAEAMRNIALRIPEGQKMMFTAQLLQDPILLARMLRTYKADPKNQMGFLNSLKSYANSKGFVTLPLRTLTGTRDTTIPEGDFDPREENSNTQTPPVERPTTQAGSAPPASSPKAETGGAAQAAGPANPALRTRYSSLFPNDPISGLLNQQKPPRTFARGGIASLLE